jgi:aminoglycoside 6'-N-acetyltransferase
VDAAHGTLRLLPMTRDHFPLFVSWLERPHVAQWWDRPRGPDEVEQDYGPCVDGSDPTLVFVAELSGTPVGFVQVYRLADNPEYEQAVGVTQGAGIDLFIGEEELCGHGLGVRLIGLAAEAAWASYPDVTSAVAGPSVHNVRSVRAFEKARFVAVRQVTVPGEADDELVLVCPRPTGR